MMRGRVQPTISYGVCLAKTYRFLVGRRGSEGIARRSLEEQPPSSSLVVFDKDGKVIWTAP
jgi:hypothetical protein